MGSQEGAPLNILIKIQWRHLAYKVCTTVVNKPAELTKILNEYLKTQQLFSSNVKF